MRKKQITIMLNPELLEQIDTEAKELNLARNGIISMACSKYFNSKKQGTHATNRKSVHAR
jgi:metal-responsive CopG/Arc/MetJ family transcriptional regulator